jgi:hypothetical protein
MYVILLQKPAQILTENSIITRGVGE